MGTDYSESLPLLGDLPKHWEIVEFGSILDGGTRNGIYKKKEFHGRGDKIVNMGELFAFPRLFSVPMKRVELSEKEQEKFRLQEGDLLFARRSLVAEGAGKCSLVCEVKEPTTFESSIIRARPNSDRADSHYLFYLFRSLYGTYILDTIRRQVAVSGITGTDLVKLPIPLPPLDEQKKITYILGTLDDKIELNQQMNRTLEGIARALFKSWFIDFDPVRAKLDGRQPYGMDTETAALFPTSFDDSPLGKIPKGWEVQNLDKLLTISRSGLNPENFEKEEFDYYSLPTFDAGRLPKLALGSEIKSNKYILPEKAVLLSKLNPHIPRIWFPSISQDRKSICSTEFLVMVPLSKLTHEFLYTLFSSQSFSESFSSLVTGTSGSHQRVKPDSLLKIQTITPDSKLINKFTHIVKPLYENIHRCIAENQVLVSTRDALLPKLLSGEIRVKEAEQALETVA